MKYIELQGSWREIGRAHGEAFREDIRKYYDFYCLRRGKTPQRFAPGIRAYVQSHLPDIIEEIRGIAEGAAMAYDEILVYNHFNVIAGCTPVFFRTSDYGPIVAQTLDCEREELQANLVRHVRPDRGHGYIGGAFVGTVWLGNYVNDAGLGRGAVSAHHHPYLTDNGTAMNIIDRLIANQAATVDEAFAIMKAHRLIGKIGVYLYAHESGRALLIEGDGERRWKTDITEPFAFTTGLFTTGNVVVQDEPDYIRPKIARQETINALYAAGQISFTLDGMKRLLAHHAPDPGAVCRHNADAGMTTQSARIALLRERKLLITEGPPCTAPYQEFSFKG